MWFEVLPSAAVITVMMAIPGYALYGLHKVFVGNVSVLKINVNRKVFT